MKSQIEIFAVGLAGAALLFSVASAQAQQVGSYIGRTADGNRIRFDIVSDAQGQLAIADLSLSFSAACGQTGTSMTQSWQFIFSKGLPIVGEHVKHVENNPQLYLVNSISFDGKKVTGTTEARLPVLLGGKSPGAVQLCVSGKQAFEATFQSADNANPFENPGRARLKTPERTAILEWSSQGAMHQELRKQ
ncbi:MAG: hypothetical protein JO056_01170 [Alphaproteobacteria bacterium]|jgi:hypothetical protein|nr:hypothetical protein [Alphaproteobacteria bacterium]